MYRYSPNYSPGSSFVPLPSHLTHTTLYSSLQCSIRIPLLIGTRDVSNTAVLFAGRPSQYRKEIITFMLVSSSFPDEVFATGYSTV
jgi:hypothetical protein